MKEGSLDAPMRHPIPWQDPAWYDEAALEAELRRVYDICHGCRRCFNLCDAFPKLFDMIDDSANEEVADLTPAQLGAVVDECTLCDMCFMVKCPYVPPHPFDLDFPHLMLRHRAVANRKRETGRADRLLAETDRNGQIGSFASGIANWAIRNKATRALMRATLGVDPRAHLPTFADEPMTSRVREMPAPDPAGPAHGRKVVLYATCHGNFSDQGPGWAAAKVLALNGVEVRVEHPQCCAMPKLENGDLAAVADAARAVAAAFAPLIADGWDVVPLTTSCALMLKFEWPLILPEDEAVATLARHSYDLSQYVVALAKQAGLAPVPALDAAIGVHFACHARAQNMGPQAMELLRLIPGARPHLAERCSGHGGKWGIFKENWETAVKVGRPAARALAKDAPDLMVSECPLAGPHLRQVIALGGGDVPDRIGHPIEVLAKAYGV